MPGEDHTDFHPFDLSDQPSSYIYSPDIVVLSTTEPCIVRGILAEGAGNFAHLVKLGIFY